MFGSIVERQLSLRATDERAIRGFLPESQATSFNVPYRANRAVIFNSDLFHEAGSLHFRLRIATPPRSNIDERFLSSRDRDLFRSIERIFVESMRRIVTEKGLGLVDLSAAMTNADGTVRADAYVDSNHILPADFIEALRQR